MQNLARPLSLFSALSSLSHRLMTVSNLSSLPNQIISPFIGRNTACCLVPTQPEKIFFHACKKQFRFDPLISPYDRGGFLRPSGCEFQGERQQKKYFSGCKKQFRFHPLISPYSRGGLSQPPFRRDFRLKAVSEKAALHIRAHKKRSKEDIFNALAVAKWGDTAPGNLDARIAAPMIQQHPTHYKGGDSLEYQISDPAHRVYNLQN